MKDDYTHFIHRNIKQCSALKVISLDKSALYHIRNYVIQSNYRERVYYLIALEASVQDWVNSSTLWPAGRSAGSSGRRAKPVVMSLVKKWKGISRDWEPTIPFQDTLQMT